MSYPLGQAGIGESRSEPRTALICNRLQGIIESLTGTQHGLCNVADRLLGPSPTPVTTRDPGGKLSGGPSTMAQIEDLVAQLDRLGIEVADQCRRLQSV